ncbi:aryl hydrocarbon receptor-like [Cololabis saira]|uniref:aryl hydrocarbon receptor-like n=1 Tax=Cololabis saira TaxID=129043 RepID=UPI002AD31CDA|nr:aryl hydrocarbon receptor-like [Cololabis saira]
MSNNMYAGRKRRKPAQKGVKPTPPEGAKSNPSKRHRDRLNSELDRLASLLPFPEDVISSLDKLSILRLSVSYLRTKGFFSVALKKQRPGGLNQSDHDKSSLKAAPGDGRTPEGELLLQALNGFVLVVTAEGVIFFCSHTIQDYLGFHQTDVMHQSVFELIHTEDQQEFRRNLHWALNPPVGPGPPTDAAGGGSAPDSCLVSYNPEQLPPENSSFLERAFVCRFRCLLDNSSGFLPLNIQGRLKFLHGQSRQPCDSEGSAPPQLALFAIGTPLQPPAILEIRTRNMIFRTKHKLDFTPMACDAKGKIVLGYTEAELRVRGSGYQFIHAADMLYCAENHVRMIKTGESGLTVFRLLTKDNRWKWVQANARLVYKNGKPDYIIATQRPLVDEEGEEHLRKRSMHLPFTFTTGEALLYQTGFPLHGFPDSFQGKAKGSKPKKGKVDGSASEDLNPKSLLGALMSQDESVYVCRPDTEPKESFHTGFCSKSDGLEGLSSSTSWNTGSNGELGRYSGSSSGFDPLLATLDSLSLDGGETCSNSELFSALENLGLNAEDLELLLLDERMIQVELDPNHVPSLTDLLTNNEILSYIHTSLENGSEEQRSRSGLGVSSQDPAQGVSQQACLPPAAPPPFPGVRHPIVQLSQQMQQHIKAQTQPLSHPGTGHPGGPKGVPQNPWVGAEDPHQSSSNIHQHQTPLKSTFKHFHPALESRQQWGLQQTQQQASGGTTALLDFQKQLGPAADGCCVPAGHQAFPAHVELSRPDYSSSHPALNASATPDICHHHGSAWPYQTPGHQDQNHPQMLQQAPPPAPCLSNGSPGSALELQQLLSLSQPQHSLPSLEAYSVFGPTPDTKVEDSCLLSYARTCLLPGTNGLAPRDVPVPRPTPLPALQDGQKPGFFL